MNTRIAKENHTKIHMLSIEEVFRELNTSENGLSEIEAKKRLKEYGPNIIREFKKKSIIIKFFEQFKSLFAILLIISSLLAAVLNMIELSVAIILIVIINAIVGLLQEYRAEKLVKELKKLMPLYARVCRDGIEKKVQASELVPGDLIILEEGDRVPADARLIESFGIAVSSAALTGESVPQAKNAEPFLEENVPLIDIPNILLMGTTIVSGHGKAIVFSTGMKTNFGSIANLAQAIKEEPSPLQIEISRTAKTLSIMAIIIGMVFFIIGILLKISLIEAFLFGIGVMVACIPEGLQATISVSLAMSIRRMARRNALVKRLSAVETLGCVTVICTDKTGTITKGEMTVTKIWINNKVLQVTGIGYEHHGDFILNGKRILINDLPELNLLFEAAVFCNNAKLIPPSDIRSRWGAIGDPTEVALLIASQKLDFNISLELAKKPRIYMLPFDSKRKMMSSIHNVNGRKIAYVKGAPIEVLSKCKYIIIDGVTTDLSFYYKDKIISKINDFAKEGLRILAFAYKEIPQDIQEYTIENIEKDLVFIGLMAMYDPPRPEVKEAIEKARRAGIKIIMVTGDHELTAKTIALQTSIMKDNESKVFTGADLDRLSDNELLKELDHDGIVFARITPEHKLRLVNLLKKKGEIVAVTGDGVNDAPSLKAADIGIAMGINGTDVAKESADVILLDDNFATIVNAIEEGRGVYRNIKRFTTYILSSNWPELIPFIAFVLLKIPLALTIMQILAVDLGTDVFPALALGVERPKPILMLQPPRSRKERLLDFGMIARSFFLGMIEALASMISAITTWMSGGWNFGHFLSTNSYLYRKGTTMAFASIVTTQIGNVFACRTSRTSIFKVGFLSNKWVFFGILGEVIITVFIIYLQPLQYVFNTVPLSLYDWFFLFMFSPLILFTEEIRKFFLRRLKPIEIEM
ncbi:MAG: cation-transporting P-type ATPase [Candidatus Micrarchaeia archaeon]